RPHAHRVFDRRHHAFRLDLRLSAQHLQLLVKQIRHSSSLKFFPSECAAKTHPLDSPCASPPAGVPRSVLPSPSTPSALSRRQNPPAALQKTSHPPPARWL